MVQPVPSTDSGIAGSPLAPAPPPLGLDLSAVLETLDQGLVVCDRDQTITLVNAAARRLLGLGTGELTAASLTEKVSIYIPGDRTPLPSDRLPLWRGLKGETLGDLELAIVHPQGDRYLVLVNSRPLFDASGQTLGAVMGLYDITALPDRNRPAGQQSGTPHPGPAAHGRFAGRQSSAPAGRGHPAPLLRPAVFGHGYYCRRYPDLGAVQRSSLRHAGLQPQRDPAADLG